MEKEQLEVDFVGMGVVALTWLQFLHANATFVQQQLDVSNPCDAQFFVQCDSDVAEFRAIRFQRSKQVATQTFQSFSVRWRFFFEPRQEATRTIVDSGTWFEIDVTGLPFDAVFG